MILDRLRYWYEKGGIPAILNNGTAWVARRTLLNVFTTVEFGDRQQKPNEPVILQQALLVGPHATLVSPNIVYGDSLRSTPSKTRWMFGHATSSQPWKVTSALCRGSSSPTTDVSGPAVVLYHHTGNYSHWLREQLPKLRLVPDNVTIIVPDDCPQFVKDGIARAGYGEAIWYWDGSPVWISQVIVPQMPLNEPVNMEWLRDRVGGSVVGTPGSDRFYISRANATKGRRVTNHEALQDVLEQFDIEVVQPEFWSLDEQIRRFADAELIVGPHGAGLANSIWATDATVIELDINYYDDTPEEYTDACGHAFCRLQCERVGEAREAKNHNIRVQPGKLKAEIRAALGEQRPWEETQ